MLYVNKHEITEIVYLQFRLLLYYNSWTKNIVKNRLIRSDDTDAINVYCPMYVELRYSNILL